MEYRAPMSAAVKPTQFKSGNEEGKTNTCLQEMNSINKYYMNLGKTLEQNSRLDNKNSSSIPIHIIFTNNSLIETKQWKNKIANFGVNNMAILSSQDTKTKGEIDSLINTGDDSGRTINYIMCCANKVRMNDIEWIIRQYSKKHTKYVFNLFLDEFDKLPMYVVLIKAIQKLKNVANIVAISATAYSAWFNMFHELGYSQVPLLTKIEDSSDYRRIKDHRLFYTDMIRIEDPVKNFLYILENPGEVCYHVENIRITIPDLKAETGKIFFVPGTFYTSSHDEICEIAHALGWNCLILNGKKKGYYYPDGDPLTIKEYRTKNAHLFEEYTSPMSIAQTMYNDASLRLKNTNLVITGFNCVERGVTFNVPNFQFHTAIFSEYHYREDSKAKESIIQLAGRATGWKEFVPTMNILAPKYLIDEVSDSQDELINFLKGEPSHITYADMMGDKNAVPIRIEFLNDEVLKAVENEGNKAKRLGMIVKGINDGDIEYTDENRDGDFMKTKNDQLIINPLYKLKTIRSCKEGNKVENYRFDAYISAYEECRGYGQSNNSGEFSIDINFVDHVKNTVSIDRGLGFISYAPIETE
jgi:hypothetical protein